MSWDRTWTAMEGLVDAILADAPPDTPPLRPRTPAAGVARV
jgi:hypothetical protein